METVKKKKKIWPWIVLGVVLILLIWLVASCSSAAKKMTEAAYITHTVSKGNISSTITGSGKTEAFDSFEIELPLGVETEEIIAKVGDEVSVGTELAILDIESVKSCAAQLSSEISTLDRQLAMRDTQDNVYAPVEGRIKQIKAVEGSSVVETVNKEGMLLAISADGLMRVEIETEQEISLNTEVSVQWANGKEDGKVASKTLNGYIITLDDEEAPDAQEAQILLNGEVIGEGILEMNSPVYVYGIGGIIEEIHVDIDDEVDAGDELLSVEDAPLSDAYVQALHSRNEKAEDLKKVIAYLENPVVLSEVDGIIAQINDGVADADYSAQTAAYPDAYSAAAVTPSSSAMFVIHTGGAVKMNIEVDEMDIDILALGQEAVITLDAYPSESFSASVTHISKIGTTSGSITTYAVELTLEYDTRTLEGMNGSAVITAQSVENVLLVPIDAIHEDADGVYVYCGRNEQSKKRTAIETGLSDGNYAEVKSGLSEGDTVIYADTGMYELMMQFATEMESKSGR